EEEPEVVVPEEPADIANPDLLGYWAVTQVNGEIPDAALDLRFQFTPAGEFVRYEGDTVTRAPFTFASKNQITINDVAGARFYEYTLNGDALTLVEPGEGGASISLTRLADVDLEQVQPPPEPSTSIPEDSVPADSVAPSP